MNDIKQRMKELITAMNQGAYEREEAIALTLLAAMAGESIFLLGLPFLRFQYSSLYCLFQRTIPISLLFIQSLRGKFYPASVSEIVDLGP